MSHDHVERFAGGLVEAGVSPGGHTMPAWHVCDGRGRTVAVIDKGESGYGWREDGSWHFGNRRNGQPQWWSAERRATQFAALLNRLGAQTVQGRAGHGAYVAGRLTVPHSRGTVARA